MGLLYERQGGVRLRQGVIQFDSSQRCCLRAPQCILRWETTAKPKHRVSLREAAIRRSVAWVPLDRLLERRDTLAERILCSLAEVITALQIILVSFGIDRLRRRQTRSVLRCQIQFDLINDIPRDLLLVADEVIE